MQHFDKGNLANPTKISHQKPISVILPLSILTKGAEQESLETKLKLINAFQLVDLQFLKRCLGARIAKSALAQEDISKLKIIFKENDPDDLDFAELFLSNLPQVLTKVKRDFIFRLDPQPLLNRKIYGEKYNEALMLGAHGSSEIVKRFTLPRVRAKLALKELICLILNDTNLISELLGLSTAYLSCPIIQKHIDHHRRVLAMGLGKEKLKADAIMAKFSTAIYGPRKSSKKYGYWGVDYYYSEVVECLKIAQKMPHSSRVDYVKVVMATWSIPEHFKPLLDAGTKRPAETTLEIMVDKGLITDPSTYRNVIRPHVKKLKQKYPYIRGCDPIVEHLLDKPMNFPEFFSCFDLFRQLESFTFDLTPKELKIGHAISYPNIALGV